MALVEESESAADEVASGMVAEAAEIGVGQGDGRESNQCSGGGGGGAGSRSGVHRSVLAPALRPATRVPDGSFLGRCTTAFQLDSPSVRELPVYPVHSVCSTVDAQGVYADAR